MKRNTIGRNITHPQLIIIDVTRALGWLTRHEFCRSFRNTALKEIGKIYTVQGRKFLLSFPAPYTCDQLKARGLSSRLAQSASSTQHMCMVGAVGWEPHRSSPTTCAEKADHELPCHLPARDFFFYLSKGGFSLMRLSHVRPGHSDASFAI